MSTKKTTRKNLGLPSQADESILAITPDELNELIRQGVAAEMSDRKERTFFRSRLRPFLLNCRQSRLTWFLLGLMAGSILLPFLRENLAVDRTNRRDEIIDRNDVDNPATLARNAPAASESDRRKHRTLANACRLIAGQIESKVIESRDEALSALSAETANIFSAPAWQNTADRFERLVDRTDELSDLASLLNNVATAFDSLSLQ